MIIITTDTIGICLICQLNSQSFHCFVGVFSQVRKCLLVLLGCVLQVGEVLSADVSSLPGDVLTFSADVSSLSGDVLTFLADALSLSGDVLTSSADVLSLPGDVLTFSADALSLSGDTPTPQATDQMET